MALNYNLTDLVNLLMPDNKDIDSMSIVLSIEHLWVMNDSYTGKEVVESLPVSFLLESVIDDHPNRDQLKQTIVAVDNDNITGKHAVELIVNALAKGTEMEVDRG